MCEILNSIILFYTLHKQIIVLNVGFFGFIIINTVLEMKYKYQIN